MNNSLRTRTPGLRVLGATLGCALLLGIGWAQDASQTSTQNGQATVQTATRTGTVIYASGNDLVLKADDGQVKHFSVPESTKFNVDGKVLNVHQLTPGMKLTRTITTTTTPTTVTTVRTISGTVWWVNAPTTVILTLPDGTNKQYKVPKGQMFDINGTKQSVFHLKKGMTVSATVMTETPEVVQTANSSISGQAAPPAPTTPPATGPLLVEENVPVMAAPPAPEVAEAKLPKTGSMVPLVGLLGLLFIGGSLGMRLIRR